MGTGPKNFSPKMEKTGIVSGKILGWSISMKNSSRKVGGKKWNSGWKNFKQELRKFLVGKWKEQIGVFCKKIFVGKLV